MAFVKLTWTLTKEPIYINVEHVVAVHQEERGTVVAFDVPSNSTLEYRTVVEPINDVMGQINSAQSCGK
jgi:hypothetical protein